MHPNVYAFEQFTVVTRNFEFWDQWFPRRIKYISMINIPATMRGVRRLILNSLSALFWAIDSRIVYVVSILEHFRFILENLLKNIFEQLTWIRFNNFDATVDLLNHFDFSYKDNLYAAHRCVQFQILSREKPESRLYIILSSPRLIIKIVDNIYHLGVTLRSCEECVFKLTKV